MTDILKQLYTQRTQMTKSAIDLALLRDEEALSAEDKADLFNCTYDIALIHSRLDRLINRLNPKT